MALMIALIVSAVSGIGSGKVIDKGFGRELMMIGVVLGGVCLALVPFIQSLGSFYVLWAVIGLSLIHI